MTAWMVNEVVVDGYLTEDFMLRLDRASFSMKRDVNFADYEYYCLLNAKLDFVKIMCPWVDPLDRTWFIDLIKEFDEEFDKYIDKYINQYKELDSVDWFVEGF